MDRGDGVLLRPIKTMGCSMNKRIDQIFNQVLDENGADPLYRFAELVAAAARLEEREACAKLCEEREEYSMQIPCPDGIVGCGVFHSVRGSKLKDGRECAAAIRGRTE